MAKAPQPGRSKTRLVPPLVPEQAAALSAAFLRDITDNIALVGRDAPIDGWIAYAPAGSERLFAGHLAPGTSLVLSDGSPDVPPRVQGFGRCLLHAIRELLALGYGAACLVNADGPTLPGAMLRRAAEALGKAGERVVLGPAEDGGYYLIGVKTPHVHLFEDIAWSTAEVAEQTRARVHALGVELVELEPWYDVDDPGTLRRLAGELGGVVTGRLAPYPAPVTAACLGRPGWRELIAAMT